MNSIFHTKLDADIVYYKIAWNPSLHQCQLCLIVTLDFLIV